MENKKKTDRQKEEPTGKQDQAYHFDDRMHPDKMAGVLPPTVNNGNNNNNVIQQDEAVFHQDDAILSSEDEDDKEEEPIFPFTVIN